MKVTVTVKEVNPEFSQEHADRFHDGDESEDNIRYNWEDEFEVKGDVADFKIQNNTVYLLTGTNNGNTFSFEIPGMTVAECKLADGTTTQFAASRKLIKDTKKNVSKKGDVHFFIFLKGNHAFANPLAGVYISEKDFPMELPLPEKEEIRGDEEE